jgi:hypothetical protein
VTDDRDEVVIACRVRFPHLRGEPPAIVRARRWFKHSLRGYGGHMLSAQRVDRPTEPPPPPDAPAAGPPR